MIDAIREIRASTGKSTKRFDPIHDPSTDIRRPAPLEKLPYRWGGVCIPVPFGDFDFYYTDGPIFWSPNRGQSFPEVAVPLGFCTDLASIPQFFWSFGLPRTGLYAYAAIVHDYLYWNQKIVSRHDADEILYTAMLDSGVPTITREAIYLAAAKIPYFAKAAWDGNTAAKKAGAKRILKYLPPKDQITRWRDWSKDPAHFAD